MDVYVEKGSKRVFASAVAWPGWSRSGRDERSALESLFGYGPRFAKAVSRSRLGFRAPVSVDELVVVARTRGTSTTDFGAPDVPAPNDLEPVQGPERKRLATLLRASWRALDGAAEAADGRTLRAGPRGGGRSLGSIVAHVGDAERGYLARLSWKAPDDPDPRAVRAAVLEALVSAFEHGVPERGPRGGRRWPPRYFVRRVAWHALDHAWEIEDRTPV